MSVQFASKARTLANLRSLLKSAKIADLLYFSVAEWQQNSHEILQKISAKFATPLIIRSSCAAEDNHKTSNAGAFLSLLNIDAKNQNAISQAITKVINSYGENALASDEVLVQPMLQRVKFSGVAFSHDPNTCSPYRIISWQDGEDTTAVTAGNSQIQTIQIAAETNAKNFSGNLVEKFSGVLDLIKELLTIFDNQPIDCEFAVLQNNEIYLLQARPLILKHPPESQTEQTQRLQTISNKIQRGMQPHPFLMGKTTVYGVMPDWNPAEIIGIRPKPLALSLYRELVTDNIWAYQRHNYGYRNLRSFPLMPNFFGLPYIDVRLSFNSFIPASLNEVIAGRLVDYYIQRLVDEPMLHDKVEFEIVFSCYTLDLPERLKILQNFSFSQNEQNAIADALRTLTNRIIRPKDALWQGDADKLKILNDRREKLFASGVDNLEKIYWLLEDGKRYGTLPFAGLARAGFIAVQMLKSLVAVGILSHDDYDAFMNSVSTVSGQLARDRKNLDRTTFLSKYGHLRPGTYDILSPRYDEAPDLYFNFAEKNKQNLVENVENVENVAAEKSNKIFSLTLPQMKQIGELLAHHGLQCDVVSLLDFMQSGIQLRELSKFYFTKNLSDALALISQVGENLGFDKQDLAFCSVGVFKELHVSATKAKVLLQRSIEQGKARFEQTTKVSLPPLITSPQDIWAFEYPQTLPNFITQKQIAAEVIALNLSDAEFKTQNLIGKIVCIPNADPGFDWLFSHKIAALITAWGGVNSHMAIRAGELGLPAIIGAGEKLYKKWASCQKLQINCEAKKVEVLE